MSSKSLNWGGTLACTTNMDFSLGPTVTLVRCLTMRSSRMRPAATRPMRRTFGPVACCMARMTAVICPGRPDCPCGPKPWFICDILYARFSEVLGRAHDAPLCHGLDVADVAKFPAVQPSVHDANLVEKVADLRAVTGHTAPPSVGTGTAISNRSTNRWAPWRRWRAARRART